MNKKSHSVVILGGGISGLALADRLAGRQVPCTILEAQDHIGGLAASRKISGHAADIGPHLFIASDPQVSEFVSGLFKKRSESFPELTRSARMLFGDRYIDYPLTLRSIFFQMGALSGLKAAASYFAQKLSGERLRATSAADETAESWSSRTFGRYLTRTFFKPYTEQFWKRPSRELSSAAIPISKKVTFLSTLFSTFWQPKHIDREALPVRYPNEGFGRIAELLGERVVEKGGRIELGAKVEAIEKVTDGYRVVYRQSGERRILPAVQIVSTIPISHLIRALSPAVPAPVLESADRVEYLGLIVVCLVTNCENVLGGHQYVYTMGRPYHRISEMGACGRAVSPPGKNLLLLEVTDTVHGENWQKTDQEIYETCRESILQDGHLKSEDILEFFVMRAPEAYPFFKIGFQQDLELIKRHIDSLPGIHLLGRTGTFTYLDSDLCMSQAFDLAEKLS